SRRRTATDARTSRRSTSSSSRRAAPRPSDVAPRDHALEDRDPAVHGDTPEEWAALEHLARRLVAVREDERHRPGMLGERRFDRLERSSHRPHAEGIEEVQDERLWGKL